MEMVDGIMKTFIGIKIPDSIQTAIYDTQTKLRETLGHAPKISWAKKENLHITLLFLGNLDDEKRDRGWSQLRQIDFSKIDPNLAITCMGLFDSDKNPKTIWIGTQNFEKNLNAIYNQTTTIFGDLGVKIDSKPFIPHITIGRIRFIKNITSLMDFIHTHETESFGKFLIDTITLFESQTTPDGPQYNVIDEIII